MNIVSIEFCFQSDEENMSKPPLQRTVQGDASETAILQFNEIVVGKVEEYREKNKRVCDIPFNSANKYQVSIHETDDGDERHLLVVKDLLLFTIFNDRLFD
jgi:magnesium-transporting ATPase (P-type)